MSAPLVVNTKDGLCWLRRAVTRDGLALYAPEGVCVCPEFVMATEAELAEHGIVGSADVLPVPAAETHAALEDTLGALLARHAEVETLRARVGDAVATVARQAQKIAELERIANAERARVAELEGEHASSRTVDEDPIAYALTPKAAESVDKLTALLAPTQVLRLDGDV